MMMMILIIYN